MIILHFVLLISLIFLVLFFRYYWCLLIRVLVWYLGCWVGYWSHYIFFLLRCYFFCILVCQNREISLVVLALRVHVKELVGLRYSTFYFRLLIFLNLPYCKILLVAVSVIWILLLMALSCFWFVFDFKELSISSILL